VYPLVVGHLARVRDYQAKMQEPGPIGAAADGVNPRKNYLATQLQLFEDQVAAFAQLGDWTGGRAFDPPDLTSKNVKDTIQALAGQVRFEYVIGFSPAPSQTPRPHKMTVRLVGHKDARLTGGERVAVY
jgi:hypothetical protein